MKDTYALSGLLQQVSLIRKQYDDLALATGESFNLFSIMHMESSEDWTHSAMIYSDTLLKL